MIAFVMSLIRFGSKYRIERTSSFVESNSLSSSSNWERVFSRRRMTMKEMVCILKFRVFQSLNLGGRNDENILFEEEDMSMQKANVQRLKAVSAGKGQAPWPYGGREIFYQS
jgi:hypothetical protein